MEKQRVLFLCNANSARSLMGEALLRHMAGDRFEAFSAGVEPSEPHRAALKALESINVSIRGLASKPLETYADQTFDTVIILCEKARQHCRDWEGRTRELIYWDIQDPRLHDDPRNYQHTLQEIQTRLKLWLGVKSRAHP
ncbi:arsenate reductase ArsC [Salinicola sp. MIT1003]|uniref:arsenate reductase ArsC n=1 Tax=Salinicola sp. MIT1003 TaxID=1882734 RepID=UPI0008DCF338|nr:arsenate reductase ArsC [Salinicola sp. MIT1003]OHZ00524.1 protein tyrosine phosphatase [Salinicola sp. MIT1003]